VVSGGPKTVLLRGVGPGLAALGVQGSLPNPKITLFPVGIAAPIASNDNWGNSSTNPTVVATARNVGAFPYAENSFDAALLVSLDPGIYLCDMESVDSREGVGLFEIYDVAGSGKLSALSVRGQVEPGNPAIPSVVITGPGTRCTLFRAVGPGLASTFGLPGTLSDPTMSIVTINPGKSNFTLVSNDNWSDALNAYDTSAYGAMFGEFPLVSGSKDAAVFTRLEPGIYSMVIQPNGNISGVVLGEIYFGGN
jgi:hypothetical protein